MAINLDNLIELSNPQLNNENFINQITEFGYFSEQFPTCFSSSIFSSKLDDLLLHISCTKSQVKKANNATLPTKLSIRKDDISRRTLSLPNPKAFLRLCKLMQDNWDDILELAKSKNSLSPITYVHRYNDISGKAMLNCENVREGIRSKSDYVDGLKNSIQAALGFKYMLKVDIANCYNSIYTHSVAWAMCGKSNAKKYLRTGEPKELKDTYELADKLDAFIRFQKNNETNGIIIGPFTSRIFSELILSAIDRQLVAKGFTFRRYVDDYKFYFRTDAQAKDSIPSIERTITEYGFNLNNSKTEIKRYPFEIISQMKTTYENALKQDGVFGVFNAASMLYYNGEKGAYKYALKFVELIEPLQEDFGVIMSSLINILLIEPKNGKYVVNYLKRHIHMWNSEKVIELINRELGCSINDESQQETLVFLHIIKELNLHIYADNLIKILSCSNDFAIIIALDIWKNRKTSVIRNKKEASTIREKIEQLSRDLIGEEYTGARWLLLYEIKIHSLIKENLIPSTKRDEFFDKMYESRVTFYQSINQKFS